MRHQPRPYALGQARPPDGRPAPVHDPPADLEPGGGVVDQDLVARANLDPLQLDVGVQAVLGVLQVDGAWHLDRPPAVIDAQFATATAQATLARAIGAAAELR